MEYKYNLVPRRVLFRREYNTGETLELELWRADSYIIISVLRRQGIEIGPSLKLADTSQITFRPFIL